MRKMFLAVTVLTAMLFLAAAPAVAHEYGCTPGYWKNHTSAWVGYSPDQTLATVFPGLRANYTDGSTLDTSATLLEALRFPGGSTDAQAAQILLRAAVAALLNAAHPEVHAWNGDTASVIEWTVNSTVYLPADGRTHRSSMLALAYVYDQENNVGCPL